MAKKDKQINNYQQIYKQRKMALQDKEKLGK